jgi:hypothetical protein
MQIIWNYFLRIDIQRTSFETKVARATAHDRANRPKDAQHLRFPTYFKSYLNWV